MVMGRPKNPIPRSESLHLRLTDFEFKKISRVAKEKNLTKTDAILKGIDLLEHDKPKIYRSQFNKLHNIPPVKKNSDVDLDLLDEI